MPRLVLMCGLAGSGKSTYARRLEAEGYRRFTIDGAAYALGYRVAGDIPAEVAQRIRDEQRQAVADALDEGEDVVVDHSLWSRGQREQWRAIGRAHGAEVSVVFMDTPRSLVLQRLAQRAGAHEDDFVVDGELLAHYLRAFRPPGPDEDDVTVVRPRVRPEPTERLRFREMTDDDLDLVAGMLGDPEVMRHYPRPRTRAEAADWIAWSQRNYDEHGFGLWVVETHAGEFVGDCGLTWQPLDGRSVLEVGYHVVTAEQGRGFATEAARACVELALNLLDQPSVYALIAPTNTPSRRAAEKLGLRLEHETTAHDRPVVVYATSSISTPG